MSEVMSILFLVFESYFCDQVSLLQGTKIKKRCAPARHVTIIEMRSAGDFLGVGVNFPSCWG